MYTQDFSTQSPLKVSINLTVCQFSNFSPNLTRFFSLQHMHHHFHLGSMFSFQSFDNVFVQFNDPCLVLVIFQLGSFYLLGQSMPSSLCQQTVRQEILKIFAKMEPGDKKVWSIFDGFLRGKSELRCHQTKIAIKATTFMHK